MRHWSLALVGLFVLGSVAVAAGPNTKINPPAKIGQRSAVLEFRAGDDGKPSGVKIISSESLPLGETAKALLLSGKIGPGSAGVSQISDGHYRLIASLPVPYDGSPLPPDVTPPVPRLRPCPAFPRKLVEANIAGGVVLRLDIDENAKLQKAEVVSASHPEFGPVALQAVEKWVFAKPASKGGKPIAISVFQLLTFEYEGGKQAPLPWQIAPEPHLSDYLVTTMARPRPSTADPQSNKN